MFELLCFYIDFICLKIKLYLIYGVFFSYSKLKGKFGMSMKKCEIKISLKIIFKNKNKLFLLWKVIQKFIFEISNSKNWKNKKTSLQWKQTGIP